jgi:4-amino-4-deoxy-L-arabinose transferase-like glycosyltransferase
LIPVHNPEARVSVETKSERLITNSLAILLASLVLLKVFEVCSSPFVFNEGVYANAAKSILEGKALYTDVFDHKPPLLHYSLALAFWTLGSSILTIHLLALLFDVLLALVLFLAARRFFELNLALLAPVVFLIFSFPTNLDTEVPMTLFGVLGLCLYILSFERKKPLFLFLSGVFQAISVWFKQPGIFFFAAVALHQVYLAIVKEETRKGVVVSLGLVVAGALTASLPLLAYFMLPARVHNFCFAVIKFSLMFKGATGRLPVWGRLAELLLAFWPLLAVILFSYRELLSRNANPIYQRMKEVSLFSAALLMLSFLSYPEIFLNHMYQILPFLILLTLMSVHCWRGGDLKRLAQVFFVFFVLWRTFFDLGEVARARRDQTVEQQKQISQFLLANCSKFFSTDPQFYFMTGVNCDYKVCFVAPSTASVFSFSDFATYATDKDCLVLTWRQKLLGEDNLKFIGKHFTLLKRFDGSGVEVWKRQTSL